MKQAWAVGVVCLALAACSSGGSSSVGEDGETKPGSLAELTPSQMCEFLPTATVEKAYDVTIAETKGDEIGRVPVRSVSCDYSEEGIGFEFETSVELTHDESAQKSLDQEFTDLDDKVVDYQRVDGLGEPAGYGPDAKLEEFGGDVLAVVIRLDGEMVMVTLEVKRDDGGLEQLKPLATALTDALKSKLE